jgi:hypothetical protein
MKKEKSSQININHIKTMVYIWLAVSLGRITNKIRKMILKIANLVQGQVLTPYHMCFTFKTKETKPTTYRLELIAELRSELECDSLISQIFSQLFEKFNYVDQYKKEIETLFERKRIEENFNSKFKEHVSIKFLFRQWVTSFSEIEPIGPKTISVIDHTIPSNGVTDYRVNILKNGELPYFKIKEMFCVEINTTDLK